MDKIKRMKSYSDLLADLKNRVEETKPNLNPFPLTPDQVIEEGEPVLRQIYKDLAEKPSPDLHPASFGKRR